MRVTALLSRMWDGAGKRPKKSSAMRFISAFALKLLCDGLVLSKGRLGSQEDVSMRHGFVIDGLGLENSRPTFDFRHFSCVKRAITHSHM